MSVRNLTIDPHDLFANASNAAVLLKAVGNPYRLMILCCLLEGERSVGQLNERIEVSQATLSQHLAVLRRKGLVKTRREAQTIFYSLRGNEVTELMHCLYGIFCDGNRRSRRA